MRVEQFLQVPTNYGEMFGRHLTLVILIIVSIKDIGYELVLRGSRHILFVRLEPQRKMNHDGKALNPKARNIMRILRHFAKKQQFSREPKQDSQFAGVLGM